MKRYKRIYILLGVLAACLGPFVRLGVQYLLYKLTAFLAGMTAAPELAKLIDALGGVFGLMLGMTGSCARWNRWPGAAAGTFRYKTDCGKKDRPTRTVFSYSPERGGR